MSKVERTAWNRRYRVGDYRPRTVPSPFLQEWLPAILGAGGATRPGRALDVASGAGRHALRLAEAGFSVDAVDISDVALEIARQEAVRRGLDVNWITADLDDLRVESGYRLITVFHYRNPRLWQRLVEALAPDAWILVQHHLQTPLPVDGPRSQAFRVPPGELLEAFGSLRVVHYSERVEPGDRPGTTYAMVRLAACRGDPGW